MREISEDSVSAFLENKEALAPCNVAAFVYDRCVCVCMCVCKCVCVCMCVRLCLYVRARFMLLVLSRFKCFYNYM